MTDIESKLRIIDDIESKVRIIGLLLPVLWLGWVAVVVPW